MNITFICGAGIFSGKEKVTLNLMRELRKNNHNISCITSKWGNGQFSSLLENEKIIFIKTRLGFISLTFTMSAIKMTLHQLLYLPKLWYDYIIFVKRVKPDVVIHTNFHHLLLLYPVLSSKQKHFYHSHESIIYNSKYRWLFGLFNKKITTFIGVSSFVANTILKLGLSQKKVCYIHNGVDSSYFKVINRKEKSFNIGIIGQIGKWKGHEDLFKALKLLKLDGFDFNCIIIGSGNQEYIEYLKEIANDYNIINHLIWKGFILNQDDIYRDIDVICVPSRSEDPLPTTAIEAGIYGIPVIASKKGGLPEIIEDSVSGFLINTDDSMKFAEKLKLLASDHVLMEKMCQNASEHIKEKFNIDRMTKEFENCLSTPFI